MSEKYMKLAVEEAVKAYSDENVPVGAVIVNKNKVIASAHNMKNSCNISVYHAEILAIIEACKNIGSWYLNDCSMYVTLRPCEMCLAAIAESRISKVYYLIDSNYSESFSKNKSNIIIDKMPDKYNYLNLIGEFFEKLR